MSIGTTRSELFMTGNGETNNGGYNTILRIEKLECHLFSRGIEKGRWAGESNLGKGNRAQAFLF